jgi:hypothetical protein
VFSKNVKVPDDRFCIKITLQFLQRLPIDRQPALALIRQFEYRRNAHVVVKQFTQLLVGGPIVLAVWADLKLKADALADDAVELLRELNGLGAVLAEQGLTAIFVNPQAACVHLEDDALERTGEVVCRSRLGPELWEEFV